jgi:gliding motility-associated-like protein
MKVKLLPVLTVLLLSLIFSETRANHVLGGNLTWECLGGDQYQITYTQYRDCFAATPALSVENVFFFPNGCGSLPFIQDLNFVSELEISDLCPTELANSSCESYFANAPIGGIFPGVTQVVYSAVVTLPAGCTWKIVWNENNWNYFNNIDWSTYPAAYIYSEINTNTCSNSVDVTSLGAPFECIGQGVITYQLATTNSSGAVLTYTLETPQTTGANPSLNQDVSGYTAIPGLTISPTGLLSLNTIGLTSGFYTVNVAVQMTIGGISQGVVHHAMTFYMRDCTTTPTTFDTPEIQSADFGIIENNTTIGVCAGDSLCFSVQASNTNLLRTITITESHPAVLNSGNPTLNQSTLNPAIAEFCMLTDETMIGTHVIQLEADDDACLLPGHDDLFITVNIYPSISLSVTDTMICMGESVTTVASGGSSYTWSVLTGDATPGFDGNNGTQVLESITSNSQYLVVLNGVPASCEAQDTLFVFVSLQDLEFYPTDESCLQNDGAVNLVPIGGSANYTYSWDNGAITEDLTGLDGIQYCVTVTDTFVPNCTATECVTINSTPPPGGSIDIGGLNTTTVCSAGPAVINFALTGTGPWVVNGTGAGIAWPLTINAMPYTVTVNPTTNTTYTLTSIAYQAFPACVTNVNVPVTVNVRPYVTGVFQQAAAICNGQSTPLIFDASAAGSYNVTWSASPADPAGAPNLPANPWSDLQSLNGVNPTQTTTYSITDVQYTTAPFCSNPQNNVMTVTVNPLPTFTTTGTATICTGDNAVIGVTATGTPNWSFNGTGAGITWPITGVTTANSNITVISPPTGSNTYCITSVTDGNGCTATVNECETFTVTGNVTPSVTITANPGTTICAGTSVTFTATPTNGGTTPTYQWFLNGNPVGSNSPTYTNNTLANTNTIYVVMTSSLSCVTTATATSTTLTMTVNPVVTPSVSINSNPVGAICAGTSVTFTAIPSNGGFAPGPTYQWNLNTVPQPGQTGNTFTSSTLVNGDIVTVTMVSGATCPSASSVNSPAVTMTVNPVLVPSITITAAPTGTICAGANVTFTAVAVNPGAAPTYSWLVNGNPAPGATNATTYSSTTLADNDVVSVDLTSNALCASTTPVSSNDITMDVNPLITPSVTIAASPAGAICAGTSVTFTATPTNGGTGPTYAWFLNNGATGITGPTYTNPNFANGDQVYVVMTSNGSCLTQTTGTSATTTMTVNPLPTATLSASAAVCQGQSHTFNVTYTGTAPYSNVQVWNATTGVLAQNIGGGNTFTTSTAGSYFITTVTDNNGCTNTADSPTVILTVNSLPTGTLDGPSAICAGGSHTFNIAFTGAADYDYTISTPGGPAGPFNSATNMATYTASAAGNYSIASVTDNNGCTSSAASATALLTVNPLPTATMSANATICAGQSHNFSIAFTGTGPWDYDMSTPGGAVSPPNAATSPATYAASAAGNYSVTTVTDANSCTSAAASNVAILTVNALPTAVFSANGTECTGVCHDFTITLTGQSPWNFDIQGPNGPDAGNTHNSANAAYIFSACDEGNYYVTTITDNTGCVNNVDSPLANLDLIPLPTASWVTTDTSYCAGASVDVEITLTGTAPFTVNTSTGATWNEATTTMVETINTPNNYCIDLVTDNTGCTSAPLDCIQVDEISLPIVNAGLDLEVCAGLDIQIGTVAIAGQTYSWTDPSGILSATNVAQPTANSLIAGVYPFTVTANNAQCALTDNMNLTVNALPTVSIVADDATICFNGTSELTASGAQTYDWTASASLVDPVNSNPMNVLPAVTETFTVTGTDANGCIDSETIEITVGTELLVAELFPADLCFGACDGTIELTPSGSYGTYVIDWAAPNPDLDTFLEEDLCAGTYDYTVTDAQNCVYNGSVFLNPLPYNYIDDVIILPPACFGESTGQIEVIDPAATTYNITGPQILTNSTGIFTDLSNGAFNVLITDALGCISDSTVLVNSINPQIIVTPTVFNTPFCFEELVPFEVTAVGGSGNFTIHWHNCDEINCEIGINSPFNLSLTQDTTLYFYAEDLGAPGCFSDTLSVSAILNPPIELEILNGLNSTTLCTDQCFDMTAVTTGGNGSVVVDWFEVPNPITSTPVNTGLNYTVCPLVTTSYYAYAYDGCNPPAYDYFDITVFETPAVIFTVDTTSGCYPVVVNFENLTDPALVDACLWDFGNNVTQPICGTIQYTYTQLGSFFPSLTVTSPDGCVGTDTLDTPITIYGYPEIEFQWTPENVSVLEPEVQFENWTMGGTLYEWEFSTLGSSTDINPVFEFPDVDLAVFPVCLMSENEFGCRDTVCHDIVIESIFQIFAPNAFTPDFDGRNEVWLPVVTGVDPNEYTLRIFDRWGTLVFTTNNPNQAWTGNIENGQYYTQTDTFVWRIEAKRLSDSTFEVREGYVTVVR